jgi:hypothetical protein
MCEFFSEIIMLLKSFINFVNWGVLGTWFGVFATIAAAFYASKVSKSANSIEEQSRNIKEIGSLYIDLREAEKLFYKDVPFKNNDVLVMVEDLIKKAELFKYPKLEVHFKEIETTYNKGITAHISEDMKAYQVHKEKIENLFRSLDPFTLTLQTNS